MATENSNPEQQRALQTQHDEQLKVPSVALVPMHATGPNWAPESRLGERIRYARGQLDLNGEALSRLTEEYDSDRKGVSPTSISRYESGENFPGTVEFRLLCDALGVPPNWLLYGDVPNSGQTESEQDLIRVMRSFIRTSTADDLTSGLLVAPHLQWVVRGTRDQLLSNARKPRPRKTPK